MKSPSVGDDTAQNTQTGWNSHSSGHLREMLPMRRRTFDLITSSVGVLLAVLLLVAGGLLIWAYTFVNNQVTTQLTEQKIFFPAANSAAIKALPPDDAAAVSQYAGQQLTTGAQAETYANHFIAVHLN